MAQVSSAGRKFLESEEGRKLSAYLDTRGIPTIGVGHTGREVHLGLTWTEDMVDMAFARDLLVFSSVVSRLLTRTASQTEFDALVSFAYNIGAEGFRTSHTLALFNAGQVAEAGQAMMGWLEPPELLGRREREVALFEKGVY